MTKHEIICIRRNGASIRNTEGADAAAKVTYLSHTPGQVYDPREDVKCEWLVPLYGYWPD